MPAHRTRSGYPSPESSTGPARRRSCSSATSGGAPSSPPAGRGVNFASLSELGNVRNFRAMRNRLQGGLDGKTDLESGFGFLRGRALVGGRDGARQRQDRPHLADDG